jgi:hypothetical protein
VLAVARAAVLALALPAPVVAVARAAVPALVLLAPVLAVARAAVLALVLLAPVLAVARAAVPALVLLAPVLAVARAAVLALVLLAPVLALPCHGPWGFFRSLPALNTAKPVVLLAAGSTAACVCVLAVATFVLARKGFIQPPSPSPWLAAQAIPL